MLAAPPPQLVAVPAGQQKPARVGGDLMSLAHDDGDAAGFSPGAVGGKRFAGPVAAATAFVNPAGLKCTDADVGAAVAQAMRAGAAVTAGGAPSSMAELARVKNGGAPAVVPARVGAPLQAQPQLVPLSQVVQQQQQQQQYSTPTSVGVATAQPGQLTAAEALLRDKLTADVHPVPFQISVDRTLSGLDAKLEPATFKIHVPLPQGLDRSRLMVQRVVITRADCDSRQKIGMSFDDLDHRFTQSLEGGAHGVMYHFSLPSAGQPPNTTHTEVFGKTHMFDPRLVAEYAHVKDIAQVEAELERSAISDYVNVPMDSIIGKVVQRNSDIFTGQVYQNKNGRFWTALHSQIVDPLLSRIDTFILQDKTFRQAINDLSELSVTLVPQASSWVDVPSLNVEEGPVKAKELNRGFPVRVEGYIEVFSVKPAAGATPTGK